uniref:Uncharacterized protein LOC111133305 n=1 Tax=Crassostrea virginica TaxID=6565 RepID=A0A8B8E9F1_CRAVI|nr:uncharacterized protein LOC111133305 [Crassostrea virginica]
MLQRNDFSNEDIAATEELISNYLQLLDQKTPEFKRKVKTHMLCHLVDDIKRHGPPKGFTEDGFEKNHASVRNELFNQNQKNRSRDTANSFAHVTLLNHIISGGYFPNNDEWITIGSGACKIAQTEEVQQFVGRCVEEEVPIQCVKKIQRKENGKALVNSIEEVTILQLFTDLEKNPLSLSDVQVFTGNAVKTKRGELANSGEAVQFLNSKNEVMVGIFEIAYILKKRRSAEIIKASKVQIFEEIGAARDTGCSLLRLTCQHHFVLPQRIIQVEQVFHNCKDAHCSVSKDGAQKSAYIKHSNFNCYIWNKFQL